ncbi:unnamed protein product [Phaeothamnion confervicola]
MDENERGLGGAEEESTGPQIPRALVKKLLLSHLEPNAKISRDAVAMAAELLRMLVVEAHKRAQFEAKMDGDGPDEVADVEPQHFERIMAQLMLDF